MGKRQRSTSETSDDDFKRFCPTNEVNSNSSLTSYIAPSSLGTTTNGCYGCSAVRDQEDVPNVTTEGDGRTSEEVAPTENIEACTSTMDNVNPPGIDTIPDTRAGTSMEPVSAAEIRTPETNFVDGDKTVKWLNTRVEEFLRLGKECAYWAPFEESKVPLFVEGWLKYAMEEEPKLTSDIKKCGFFSGEYPELRLALEARRTDWEDKMSKARKGYSHLYERHYKGHYVVHIPAGWKSGRTI